MREVRFLTAGDSAVTVEFGNEISGEINARIRAFGLLLGQSGIEGVIETVPTYRSVTVHYDPGVIAYDRLTGRLKELTARLDGVKLPEGEVLELPVLYGGQEGPDLDFVAGYNGKTAAEVVEIHSSPKYLIYMLGFTPGFAYLGGMSDEIAAPRLETPRVKIPAGSVGIAGGQTGIYPIDSPGGWRIIGRTPVRMYDPHRAEPILPKAGQYIKFRPIGRAEYDRMAARQQPGGCRDMGGPETEGEK